jgi:hypothetical protein
MDELNLYFDYRKKLEDCVVFYNVFELKKEYYIFKWFDDEIKRLFKNCKQEKLEIIFKRIKGKTLQEIGNEYGITRERVRQIENTCIKKIQKNFPLNLLNYINKKLTKDNIVFIEDLPIQNEEYKEFLSFYFNKINAKFFDKKLNAFSIKSYYEYLNELHNKKPLLKKEELNFPKNLIKLFINENLIKEIDDLFFINKFKTKREKIEFIISLFPKGIAARKDFHLIKEKIKKFFPEFINEKERNIIAPIDLSDKIILWDWGVYIHKDNIQAILKYNLNEIIEYLNEILYQNSPIDLEVCFNEFKDELLQIGIPNKYALHSVLKIKYPEYFSYQDAPWVAKKGEDNRLLIDALEELFKEDRSYTISEITSMLKAPEIRVKALLDRSPNIIQIDINNFKHLKYIPIDKELFNKIETFIEKKVNELEFIYDDLVIDKFNLNISGIDTSIFISNYFRKRSTKFQTSNKKFIKNGIKIKRNMFNFHYLIKEKILKNRKNVTLNEIYHYFYIRGLKSKSRFWLNYFYSSKKYVCRINEEEITSLEILGITQSIIEKINIMVPNEEIKIDDFIRLLPKIKIQWNRFILGDILSTENEIFPNRNNPIWIKKK